MTPPLWSHQREALDLILQHEGFMLAHDMGTGKTRTTIEALQALDAKRVLILCPKTVVAVWPKEFAKLGLQDWARFVVHKKGAASKKTAADIKNALYQTQATGERLVVVVNYEAAWRGDLKAQLLNGCTWDVAIADESHRIKAPGGKASMFCHVLARRASRRIALTGTPMPHSPLDVYAQFRFLDEAIFGTSFSRFRARYAKMGGWMGHEVDEYVHLDDLRDKFYSISHRVEADKVLDLPGLQEYERTVELEPSALRVYRQLHAKFVADVAEGTITASNVLTRLLRLAQCASGTVKTDDGAESIVSTAKEDLLADVLDGLERDEPVVVFCRFRTDLDAVHRVAAAAGRASKELSGRRNELQDWQEGHGSVLAVQIQAGGVGIDLTRARYAVYYSVNYSLGDYDQSRRRLYRPGQSRHCTYIHLLAEGTIDQDIYAALEGRRDLVQSVLDQYGTGGTQAA
jgi:SNF2 family DNA or RNA helicase